MRHLLFFALFLTACIQSKPVHTMTVTITAVDAEYQSIEDGWGQLHLRSVDSLTLFRRDRKKGSMRSEDFFGAWQLNGEVAEGRLIFASAKKTLSLPVKLQQVEFDAQHDELTLLIQPLDTKVKIPKKMHAVEVVFMIDSADQLFWDKWMGL